MAKGKGPRKKTKRTVDLTTLGKARSSKPAPSPTASTGSTYDLPLSDSDIRWKPLVVLACVAVAMAICAYINSISNTIVFQDRLQLIPVATSVDSDAYFNAIATDAVTKPFTQPWVRLSYALDWMNYKTIVSWFHSINVTLHSLTTLYVYVFAWRLSHHWRLRAKSGLNEEFLAFCCAGMFAVHPMGVESVTYLASRSSLIAANNFMLALNAFLVAALSKRLQTKIFAWAITLGGAYMCILSGTEGLALPAVMIATLWAIKAKDVAFVDWVYSRLLSLIFCVALVLGLPFLLLLGSTHPTNTSFAQELLAPDAYLKTQLSGFVIYYLPKFFVPFGLTIDPPTAWRNVLDYATLPGLFVAASVAAIAVKVRQLPFIGFGLLFTLLTYLPHAALLQPQAVADSAFYLPMVGLCLITGGLFALWFKRDVRVATGAFAVVAIALLVLTIWRNTEWQTDIKLWESTVRASQQSARAHAMLSLELAKDGQIERAATEAERATATNDSYSLAWIAKGNAALVKKDFAAAEKAFEKAITITRTALMPKEVTTAAGLGLAEAYVRQHKPDRALSILMTVAGNAKADPRASLIAGLAYYDQKNWPKAFKYLREAVQLNPIGSELWSKLAEVSLTLDKPTEGLLAADRAMRLDPSATNQVMAARALFANRKDADATKLLQALVLKEPKNAEALAMLSRAMQRQGDTAQSEKYKNDALKADPNAFTKYTFKQLDAPAPATAPVPAPATAPVPAPVKAPVPAPASTKTGP